MGTSSPAQTPVCFVQQTQEKGAPDVPSPLLPQSDGPPGARGSAAHALRDSSGKGFW